MPPGQVVYCLGISVFQLVKLHKTAKRMFWSWNCLLSNWWELEASIQRLQWLPTSCRPISWFFWNYVAAKWNLQKNHDRKMPVFELQPRPGQLATKTKAKVLPFSNSRKSGMGLFGRWTFKFKGEGYACRWTGCSGSHNVEMPWQRLLLQSPRCGEWGH